MWCVVCVRERESVVCGDVERERERERDESGVVRERVCVVCV